MHAHVRCTKLPAFCLAKPSNACSTLRSCCRCCRSPPLGSTARATRSCSAGGLGEMVGVVCWAGGCLTDYD